MSSCCNGLFIMSLCLATVSLAAEPQVSESPPTIGQSAPRSAPQAADEAIVEPSTLEHLRAATQQLESAGMAEEAARLRAAAENISQRVASERVELARKIRELQDRSEQLRRVTGKPDKILCRCSILELSSEAAAEFEMAAEPVSSSSGAPDHAAPTDSLFKESVYKNAEEALRQLKESGRVKVIHASPEIVTAPGQRASALSGGEIPIVVPAEGNRTTVEWRWFGARCEVVTRLLDTGRIQLEFAPRIQQLNFKNSVTLDGLTVPGLTTRGADTRAEMNLGETLVLSLRSHPASHQTVVHLLNVDGDTAPAESTVTLFMVTPVAVE